MFRRSWVFMGAGLFVLLSLVPLLIKNAYYMHLVNVSLVTAIAILGLNFIVGYVGQISMGQAAFYGVGAYVSSLATMQLHFPFLLSVLAAIVAAGIIGLILGVPTLRLSGYYLAFATLGLGAGSEAVFLQLQGLTGGASGLTNIPPISIGPWQFATDPQAFFVILAFLLLAAGVALAINASSWGLAFAATKESQVAAEAIGVNTGRVKLLAFVLSSIYAAVAGALYAHLVSYVSPDAFNVDEGILMLTMVIVGGPASVLGSIFGAAFVTFLPELLRGLQSAYMLVYASIVLLVILLAPGGFAGLVRSLWARLKRPAAAAGEAGQDVAP